MKKRNKKMATLPYCQSWRPTHPLKCIAENSEKCQGCRNNTIPADLVQPLNCVCGMARTSGGTDQQAEDKRAVLHVCPRPCACTCTLTSWWAWWPWRPRPCRRWWGRSWSWASRHGWLSRTSPDPQSPAALAWTPCEGGVRQKSSPVHSSLRPSRRAEVRQTDS